MATAIVVHQLQKRLPKVMTPEVHGLLDMVQGAFFLGAAAFFWKRNRAASLAALATGSVMLGEAFVTDYPFSANTKFDSSISFETHGRIDAALASASLVTPQLLGFADTPEATLFRASAVVQAAIAGLTDYRPKPSDEDFA